jgi:hypothetical protein
MMSYYNTFSKNPFINDSNDSNIKNINYYLHPLYGYINNSKKYLWSYQFYISNPFLFNLVKSKHPFYRQHKQFIIDNTKPISYIILLDYDIKSRKCILDNRVKLLNDINIIQEYYKSKVNIYLIISNLEYLSNYNDTIEYYKNIFTNLCINFDLIEVLKYNTSFVVCNKYNSLFLLCFKFNIPITVLSDTTKHSQHLSMFHCDLKFKNMDNIAYNICLYEEYILPYFELECVSDNKRLFTHSLLRDVLKGKDFSFHTPL